MLVEFGELLAQSSGRDTFEAVHELGEGDFGWEVDEEVYMFGLAVELDEFAAELVTHG